MTIFLNQRQFDDPASRLAALGVNLAPGGAITDRSGAVLARLQTGGMLAPARFELEIGDIVYRFGWRRAEPRSVATGGWWLERPRFEQLLNFANAHGISLGLSVRVLCLVPPEWSDLGLLVRARVARPLLAWRGLGNAVAIPAADGLGTIRLPHQNEIAARRVHQLFIPGLAAIAPDALAIENTWPLDPHAALRGFLYL